MANGRAEASAAAFVPIAQGRMDLGNWFAMSAVKPGS